MKKAWKKQLPLIIGALIFFVFVFLAIFSSLKYAEVFFKDEKTQNFFITILSAVLGGVCTLVGVFITIGVDLIYRKRKAKEDGKPELFVPIKYDSAKAITIRMVSGLEQGDELPNIVRYLKNSSKAPFRVDSVYIQKDRKDSIKFAPQSSVFVEKGNLLCLSLLYKGDVSEFDLCIESTDESKTKYFYTVILNGEHTEIRESENKDVGDAD